MPSKTTPVAGHAWGGFARQAPPYSAVKDAACECRATFSAKTPDRMRAMWREHVQQVQATRDLRADFETVIAWARRDQQECFEIEGTEAGKADVSNNLHMIERVEKAVDALLAREAK